MFLKESIHPRLRLEGDLSVCAVELAPYIGRWDCGEVAGLIKCQSLGGGMHA